MQITDHHAILVTVANGGAQIVNRGGASVFYGQTLAVSSTSNDGTILSGASVTVYGPTYIRTAPKTVAEVDVLPALNGPVLSGVFNLTQNPDDTPVGVATFQSSTPGNFTALDVVPAPGAVQGGSVNGVAWIDICDRVFSGAGGVHGNFQTDSARVGIFTDHIEFGAHAYDASGNEAVPTKPIRLTALGGASGIAAGQIEVTPTNHIGFNGATPIAKPTVTGSRGGNAALASLLTALASYGLITDSTTA